MNDQVDDNWEALFEQLPVDTTVGEEHRQRLKAQALGAYESTVTPRSQSFSPKKIGQTLMKYKVPHWTAAGVLIAGVILFAWLTQSGGTPVLAASDVVDNLAKVRSARYEVTATITGQLPLKMTAYYQEPNHFRQEITNGYINIADWKAGKMIGLDPKTKQATVFNLVDMPADAKDKMQMNQFDAIRESLRKAVADQDGNVESLGEKELDGRTVVGFRFASGPMPMTLWADPKTKLPVRMETTMVGPPETKVVMTNYEFNVDLDESLFSVVVPDGYEVVETTLTLALPAEKDFLTALRMCCKASKGEFPTGFDAAAIGKYVAMYYLHEQGIAGGKSPTAEQLQEVFQIGRGFQFAMTLPAEADAHYAGVGAKQGDAGRPVFWYKPTASTKYRVIYADFSVKETESAPKVSRARKLPLGQPTISVPGVTKVQSEKRAVKDLP